VAADLLRDVSARVRLARNESIACASALAYPYGVVTTTSWPLGSTVIAQRASAADTSSPSPTSSGNA
jgi:hypothetical protein